MFKIAAIVVLVPTILYCLYKIYKIFTQKPQEGGATDGKTG
jgi:hypothetical protein